MTHQHITPEPMSRPAKSLLYTRKGSLHQSIT